MGSPVIPFNSFIEINKSSNTPIFLQIANQISNAVLRGFLPIGTKLPGSRKLSNLLLVNRNTIVAVYEELEAQGWIEVLPNKGCFILNKQNSKPEKFFNYCQKSLANYPQHTGFSFKQSNILDNPFENPVCDIALDDGQSDLRLSQISQLSKLYSSGLNRKRNLINIESSYIAGKEYLKENISNFLNLTRGLHISKDNIMITRSMEMCIYIASEILISPDDAIIVGNPGYFAVNMIFQKAGADVFTVPVDDNGIDVEAVKKICEKKKIRLLYLTPHHHYPTTVMLSTQRRIELLKLSSQYGFIILEDDYDYDFHYNNSRILPLASADNAGMVIYIGSFGRSLAPGFRTGFIVAPKNLILEMHKLLGIIDRQGDSMMDHVLGEMIEDGEIHRHLKKTLKIYQERRDSFTQLLNTYLKDYVNFNIPFGGLAIWTQWNPEINLMKLRKICLENHIYIPQYLMYQTKNLTAMRLGFGNLNINEQETVIKKISNIIKAYLKL